MRHYQLPLVAIALSFVAVLPDLAQAQVVPCTGDDTIFTGRGGSTQEWIEVKAGGACEMAIEIGARQQGIDFVKVLRAPRLGIAATAERHMVMYRSKGTPGKDDFEVGIGVIAPNGEKKLFRRTVNVTIQ